MSLWHQALVLTVGLAISNIVAYIARKKSKEIPCSVNPPHFAGIIEPVLVRLLYWLSLATVNQAFRGHPQRHAKYIDFYLLIFVFLAFLSATLGWGASVWLLSAWRILCVFVQILSVGVLRNKIRALRGDGPPPSDSRIIVLALLNWAELTALFALLYQSIRGKGIWLYESFTTQVTMNHSTPLHALEKVVVVSQISISLLLVTTLIGLYVGTVSSMPRSDDK